MKTTTRIMWLARDNVVNAVLYDNKPYKNGNYWCGHSIKYFDEDFGLRPGQCKKVKVTIEEVE